MQGAGESPVNEVQEDKNKYRFGAQTNRLLVNELKDMYIVKLCSRKVILYSISNSTVVNTCLQQSLTESKYEGQSLGEQ